MRNDVATIATGDQTTKNAISTGWLVSEKLLAIQTPASLEASFSIQPETRHFVTLLVILTNRFVARQTGLNNSGKSQTIDIYLMYPFRERAACDKHIVCRAVCHGRRERFQYTLTVTGFATRDAIAFAYGPNTPLSFLFFCQINAQLPGHHCKNLFQIA
ncbi:MAG TPA: hypothetical protein VGU61_07060 [Noviherbaspirillum sp.]|jgi:hypothetical protein|uniref:hypothetical protein n=1 Tax=Noviherbaspirillum sp. TaxID=1926288 RepID=UPI002DDD053F|nr:hypothetical protein [Noviherbaspirillum sp.]HEV2610010.1 hypothetical protein [Noviherbaspirillum sp.]